MPASARQTDARSTTLLISQQQDSIHLTRSSLSAIINLSVGSTVVTFSLDCMKCVVISNYIGVYIHMFGVVCCAPFYYRRDQLMAGWFQF